MSIRSARLIGVVLLVLGFVPGATLAQVTNDDFAQAELIATLPFTDTESGIGTATTAPDDPFVFCRASATLTASALRGGNSIWYRYTPPTTTPIFVSTAGSTGSADTMIAVFTGTSPADLRPVPGGCSDDHGPGVDSRTATILAEAGVTYWIEITRFNPGTAAGVVQLTVDTSPIYFVNKPTDSADGSCDALDCSLREAISASNAAPGIIALPLGTYTLTLAGSDDTNAAGDLDVLNATTIVGAGPGNTIIDAGGMSRALHAPNVAGFDFVLLLRGLTIRNGVDNAGGGLRYDVVNTGFALHDVEITANSVTGDGGGLFSAGQAQIVDSTFHQNTAAGGGGLALPGTRFHHIYGSTISANTANGTAGGGGVRSNGGVRLVNSTVSGNIANAFGGGVLTQTSTGSLWLHSSTVAANRADADANGTGGGGGIRLEGTPSVGNLVVNSILADNVVATPGGDVGSDCSRTAGTLTSGGFNLVETSDPSCVFGGAGDLNGVDPALGALAANGGPTRTHAPAAGSPALNAADPAGCRDSLGPALVFDQRGSPFARTADGRCDLGAYETVGGALPPTTPGAPDLAAASDSGLSSTDDVTNVDSLSFSGSCVDGDDIQLRAGGVPVGTAVACASLSYTISVSLAEGTFAIDAVATRGAQTSAPSPSISVVVDRTAPAPPTITGPVPPVPNAPNVSGTVGNPEPSRITVRNVILQILCEADLTSESSWTCGTTLGVGSHTVGATRTDRAGNVSAFSAKFSFEILDALFGDGFE